jgi:hypothetical protein
MADTAVVDRGDNHVVADDAAATKPAADTKDDATDADALAAKQGDSLDDEGLETEDERVAREATEKSEAEKKRIRIPKARFDEAMNKARAREEALQKQLQELQNQQAGSVQQGDVARAKQLLENMQNKYEDLVLDGKKEDARVVRRQIDNLREQLSELNSSYKADLARRAAVEELRYDSALAEMERTHPVLNPDSELFDESKTDEISTLLEAFAAKGIARSAALRKAVKYVVGDAAPAATAAAATDVGKQRAEEARKKAAVASKQQPASTDRVGIDSDKRGAGADKAGGVDVLRLNQNSFAKLDEETKTRLRGDEV